MTMSGGANVRGRSGVTSIAVDLGAESGRVVLGVFDGTRLSIEEVHRFANNPVRVLECEYWDVLNLFHAVKAGLIRAAAKAGGAVATIGFDTWALDFAFLAGDGSLLGNPHTYRDSRTTGMMDRVFRRISRERIFATTGIQFMEINSLYQLAAIADQNPKLLECAQTLLMIPDLFNYWLTGELVCERTNASTTQFLEAHTREWASAILVDLGIPTHFLPTLVSPGVFIGPLLAPVGREVGLPETKVVAPACHDTASAVVGVPAAMEGFAYISSGTWSLVGVETGCPITNQTAQQANMSNEGGVCGTYRFLKNVMGLWLLQGCRGAWTERGDNAPTYEELVRQAEATPVGGPLIDPDDPMFLRAPNMPEAIVAFLVRTEQAPPQTRGGLVRCVLESLALKYRWVLENIEAVTGNPITVVHIVGGGAKNALLCQLTADVTRHPVLAGPVEATVIGNLGMQLTAQGRLGGLEDIRALVRTSFPIREFVPSRCEVWDATYDQFVSLLARTSETQRDSLG